MFNFKRLKQENGIALLVTLLIMFLILFLGIYVLNFSLTETKIANSQINGEKTYYLAEAGIQEMVWKLKNNTEYEQNFETNPTWTTTFTRNNPFGDNSGSYTTTITNNSLAHGTITSTGTIDIGNNKTSQRIIKTYIYRAIGQTNMGDNGGYADGNIDISASRVNFYNGNAHSNNKFTVNRFCAVNIDQDLNAVGQYTKNWPTIVNVGGTIHSSNYPPAPDPIAMPAIDFDSDDPNSYKNKATVVYTEAEFENLIENNHNLTLNDPITYVIGNIDLQRDQNLTINGLLVVSNDITIGSSNDYQHRSGYSSVIINHSIGQQSGLFAKRKIIFSIFAGDINIAGLVYANDQMSVLSFPTSNNFTITGGLVSRKLTITSLYRIINIYYDNDILSDAFLATQFSPTITVEHWEEEY